MPMWWMFAGFSRVVACEQLARVECCRGLEGGAARGGWPVAGDGATLRVRATSVLALLPSRRADRDRPVGSGTAGGRTAAIATAAGTHRGTSAGAAARLRPATGGRPARLRSDRADAAARAAR